LTSAGTPGYIAPEILLQAVRDVKSESFVLECSSDMYSLGIIFYGLLARSWPWKANAKDDIETQNMRSVIDFSTSNRHMRAINFETRKLLEWMLQSDPKKRITCKELLRVIEKLSSDGSIFVTNANNGTREGPSNLTITPIRMEEFEGLESPRKRDARMTKKSPRGTASKKEIGEISNRLHMASTGGSKKSISSLRKI
jgi:serine/threonine protein kinase